MEAGLRQIREEGGARSAVLSEELDPPWELMIRRRAVVDKLEVQTAGDSSLHTEPEAVIIPTCWYELRPGGSSSVV